MGGYLLLKDLIKQVVSLPINGEKGKIKEQSGVSRVGELTRVILDLYYRKVFDTVLEASSPGIRYSRWYNEVFIAIDMNDHDHDDDDDIEEIMGEIIMDLESILHRNQLEGRVDAILKGKSNYLDCARKVSYPQR